MSIDGLHCDINYLWQSFALHSSLIGRFNIYNILGALGWAILMGISPEQAIKSIQTFVNVPGRMQYFSHQGVHYFVDFAHTPWGMQSVLDTVNTIKGTGRIILVCGATGNRDRYKRPQMAQIWLMHSDLMILTDDDPDTEDRYRIVWEMAQGLKMKNQTDILSFLKENMLSSVLSEMPNHEISSYVQANDMNRCNLPIEAVEHGAIYIHCKSYWASGQTKRFFIVYFTYYFLFLLCKVSKDFFSYLVSISVSSWCCHFWPTFYHHILVYHWQDHHTTRWWCLHWYLVLVVHISIFSSVAEWQKNVQNRADRRYCIWSKIESSVSDCSTNRR